MNLIKMNYLLWKKAVQERKALTVKRHLTKSFYRKMDEAIEMCRQHPRKYYLVQKTEAEWEILGSQEIRKMRKFKEAKHDENFMKLHETAPYVSPENLSRLAHEQDRRKRRGWYSFIESRYKPITKEELVVLKQLRTELKKGPTIRVGGMINVLDSLIERNKG